MSHGTQKTQWTTAERFLALSQVGTALMSELNEERLLHLIAQTACDLTGAAFAAFSLRPTDEEGQPLVPAEGSLFHLAAVIGVTKEQEALFRRMPLGGEGLLAPIFRQGVPVLVADALAHLPQAEHPPASLLSDAREMAREAAFAYAQGQLPAEALSSLGIPRGHPVVRSFLGAPLLDRAGQVRGGLLLGHAQPNQFTEEDQAILVGLAGQAAVALENARLYQLAQIRVQELQAIFDSIADGVILVDRQGTIRRENAAARRVRRTLPATPEAEQTLDALLHAPAQRILSGEDVQESLVQVMDTHGEMRDYLVTAQPLRPVTTPSSGPLSQDITMRSPTDERSLSGTVVIWRDVTERRLRELAQLAQDRASYLEAIFEAMTDGVFVYDQQGRIVQMNTAAHTLLARTVPPETATLPVHERLARATIANAEGSLLPPEQWPIARILQGNRLTPDQAVEMQTPTRDGGILYTSVTGGPIRDASGQLIGAVGISRDVTERVHLEERLRTSEREAKARAAQLEAIFETIPDALMITDATGRPLRVNTATRTLLGLQDRPEALLLSTQELGQALQFRGEDDQPLPSEQMALTRILCGETILPSTPSIALIRTLDGYERYISTTGAPMHDGDGHLIGAVTMSRDITEQKRAEREREQQAQQLRVQASLIELAHDAILVRDPHNRIVSWSRGAEQLYGWTAQEARDHVTHTLLQTQTRFPVSEETVDHILEQEGQWEGELVHTCRNGRRVTIESRQMLVRDAAGQPSAILEINRDITERRRLEQLEQEARAETEARLALLQLILDELPSGVYLVRGHDARLMLANRAATAVWGAEWATDQPLRDFLKEHDIRLFGATGQPFAPADLVTLRAVQNRETVRQHQEIIRRPDGSTLPVLVNAVALDTTHQLHRWPREVGHVLTEQVEPMALVVYQDVTALKEAEYLKDEFIGIAAHELRSPVAVLKGYAQMLLQQTARGKGPVLAPWQTEVLEEIDQAATRLDRLTADLLDVTRLQGGRLLLQPVPTDLVELVQRVASRLQRTTGQHSLALQTPPMPLMVPMDPGRIEQVLANLLANAIKYSPQGGPIEVKVHADLEKQEALISVRDSGIGIPAHQQAQVFSRFMRADNAQATGIDGTGLGLYLCRELAELHRGRIWFESVEGAGSTFFLTLPLDTGDG